MLGEKESPNCYGHHEHIHIWERAAFHLPCRPIERVRNQVFWHLSSTIFAAAFHQNSIQLPNTMSSWAMLP
jgi:hypothetical protein